MTYQAVYFRDSSGREPVKAFIDTLDPNCQDEIDWCISLLDGLSDANPELPFPYSSAVKGDHNRGIRELRASCGRAAYRILFRRSGRFFVLLHAFEKRTREIPERDAETARDRWRDFQVRMDSNPRSAPRAIGHDAP